MRNADYNKDVAKAVLARMLELLAAGPATTQDLLAASGKSAGRARDYLMHLRTIGQVQCLADALFSFKGSMPAVWALDPEYVEAPLPPQFSDDQWLTVDDFPRRVVVRSSWAPNHARMAMDCLLFGVPKVLHESRA